MSHFKHRDDAEWHNGRRVVPSRPGTVYVSTWAEFRQAGGVQNFNEDQTEIVLTLPSGYKFGIQFQDASRTEAEPPHIRAEREAVERAMGPGEKP